MGGRFLALVGVMLGAAVALASPAATVPLGLNGTRGAAMSAHPNIILILSDDQSFDSVQKMPYVRSVSPPQGTWYRFNKAFINNATCCPSRATILTGLWSHHHGVEATGGAPAYDDSDTIATRLHSTGYATAFVGKYHLGSLASSVSRTYVPPGWDDWEAFAHNTAGWYYQYILNENGVLRNYGTAPDDYSTDVLRDKALSFISANAGRPFFLVYAPRAPHNNWIAAPRHLGYYKDEPVVHPPNFNEEDVTDKPAWWRTTQPRKVKDADGAHRLEWDTVLALDDAVRAIDNRVQTLGLMPDTIIVFMTDNGYAFGEHRYVGKACAYEECSRTPLLVKFGSHAEGWTFPQLIGNEDLAPTIADLAGSAPPTRTDGQSFAAMLRSRTTPPDWRDEILLHGLDNGDTDGDQQGHPPTFWGIRTARYKYIETALKDEVELYDLRADPYELRNVADKPEYADTRGELATRLLQLVLGGTGPSTAGTASVDATGTLEFDAGTRIGNRLTISRVDTFLTLSDSSAPIAAGAGCEQVRVSTVRCSQASVSRLLVNGGDSDDTIVTPNAVDASVNGGFGNDSLTSRSGSDRLSGDGGNDLLNGGTGPDVLIGGGGVDTVTYKRRGLDHPVEVDLSVQGAQDGGAEDGPPTARDTVVNVENVTGGAGPDLLTGNGAANELVGGGGSDRLFGMDGNDVIRASQDGSVDDVSCGAGSDVAFADATDTLRVSESDVCESVYRPALAVPILFGFVPVPG
jgi:N-acetylglucosamine-6-sulfatase